MTFSSLCKDRVLNPVSCPSKRILWYVLYLFDAGWAASNLTVYVAAISVNHGHIDGRPVGVQYWVAQFLHGAMTSQGEACCTMGPATGPAGLGQVVMAGVTLKNISMYLYINFLFALVTAKGVSELHALSIGSTCLRWKVDGSGMTG